MKKVYLGHCWEGTAEDGIYELKEILEQCKKTLNN